MAKQEPKTNAMRILESLKIPYTAHTYECKEFVDGIQIADLLGLPYGKAYKLRGGEECSHAPGEGDQRGHRVHPGRLYRSRHEEAL